MSSTLGSQYCIVLSSLPSSVTFHSLKISLTTLPQFSVSALHKSCECHAERTGLWTYQYQHDMTIYELSELH